MQVLLDSDTVTKAALPKALIQIKLALLSGIQAARLGISVDDVIKKIMLKETVDGKFTTVQDVAEAVWRFAGFGSNALTWQSPVVSHGWIMQQELSRNGGVTVSASRTPLRSFRALNAPASYALEKVVESFATSSAHAADAASSFSYHFFSSPRAMSSSAIAEPSRPALRN